MKWILILLCGIGLTAAPRPTSGADTAAPIIVCSTYPIHLLTRVVIGDTGEAQVKLLVPAGTGCPHDYVLSPADMRLLMSARAVIVNGLGMDEFLRRPVAAVTPSPAWIDTSEGIPDLLPARIQAHAQHHHHHGHVHHNEAGETFNPHLFVSPRRAALLVRNLAGALSDLYPALAEQYAANADRAAHQLEELANDMQAAAREFKRRTILTEHDIFDYLAEDLGLQIAAIITTHPGQTPTASGLRRLTRTIRAQKVAAIITEPQSHGNAAATLAKETGVALATLDPVAGGPPEAALEHYITVMRANLVTLQRLLQ